MDGTLFDEDESENEVTFKANSEYAKKYNVLRRKEELLKLKNKYGEQALPDEDSSSSDDEPVDVTLTDEFEKDFFKTLSCLKNKDPRIYDKNVKFFGEDVSKDPKQQVKEKPITIRDYNRKLILENNGIVSEDEENGEDANYERPASPSYVQEQSILKKSISKALKDEDGDAGDDKLGGLFSKKKKTKIQEEDEEKGYREWLSGQSNHLDDGTEENDLKPLKEYWSDPKLGEDEAFLRDYFLNQRFRENTDDRIPSYEEIVNDPEDEDFSEDERLVGQQTEFEHKFNFRFEEPDQDFIKRYPRTLEHSLRRKDDKRSHKRAEVKERKADEKRRKKEEISQLKALKLKEIQEKIVKLKEITGNEQLAFNDEDIEGDFDPDAYDRRMKELFDAEYYGDAADNKKPEFPQLDEELEIDNWETWGDENPQHVDLHCEDEDFNMDCDYKPSTSKKSIVEEAKDEPLDGKRKRKRKKNKLADALAQQKPIFDPSKTDKTFSQYLDEYYKLDCEDVIGDMPFRFKYREVPALDYGLTTAEILMADDDELNRWYPLKKTFQYRPDHKQINDQRVLERKARNLQLKMKILPSLFRKQEEDDESTPVPLTNGEESTTSKKKRKRKKKKNNQQAEMEVIETVKIDQTDKKQKKKNKNKNPETSDILSIDPTVTKESNAVDSNEVLNKKNKKKKRSLECGTEIEKPVDNNIESEISHKKRKRKLDEEQTLIPENDAQPPKKKKNKHLNDVVDPSTVVNEKRHGKKKHKGFNKNKSHSSDKNASKSDPMSNLTNERLQAYGLNPKKYRNFMKFKKF